MVYPEKENARGKKSRFGEFLITQLIKSIILSTHLKKKKKKKKKKHHWFMVKKNH
jgi:hypothetical protein